MAVDPKSPYVSTQHIHHHTAAFKLIRKLYPVSGENGWTKTIKIIGVNLTRRTREYREKEPNVSGESHAIVHSDQLRAVMKKIYDWIRGQGEDPEE
jgi:hypothetical protein